MIETSIEAIKKCFLEYQGEGMYMTLFFISMLYIYLKEEDKKKKCLFLYFPLAIYIIVLNPLFNIMVDSIFRSSIYWRMFWMLPIGIAIAYSIVKLVSEQKEKTQKIILSISVVVILLLSGNFVYSKENFEKVGNAYKLPDDAVWVAQLIGADELENKKALVVDSLAPYIRQIDASIDLAYKRNPVGYEGDELVLALASGNVKYVTTYAINTNCNYVVFNKATVLTEPMENYGFEKMYQTTFYVIYKYTGK